MNDYVANVFNLDGRVIALTGAGGHLVGEMARALGRSGVKVAALDVSLAAAERTATEIRGTGGDALALEVDVRRKADYERALSAVLARWGPLDGAGFGAGAHAPTPFAGISLEEWDDILARQLAPTI